MNIKGTAKDRQLAEGTVLVAKGDTVLVLGSAAIEILVSEFGYRRVKHDEDWAVLEVNYTHPNVLKLKGEVNQSACVACLLPESLRGNLKGASPCCDEHANMELGLPVWLAEFSSISNNERDEVLRYLPPGAQVLRKV